MARLKLSEYRPCVVHGANALFHRWSNSFISPECPNRTCAIVEFEDGLVAEVEPSEIRFSDSRDIFRPQTEYSIDEINNEAWILCPLCDEKVCVGRFECNNIKKHIDRKRKEAEK